TSPESPALPVRLRRALKRRRARGGRSLDAILSRTKEPLLAGYWRVHTLGAWPLPARQRGQGMVEYALILVLVSIVVIVILTTMGRQIRNVFSNVVGALG